MIQVVSEALAGTRPRGSSSEADAELLQDLMHSQKDRDENIITGNFIKSAFESLKRDGILESSTDTEVDDRHTTDEDSPLGGEDRFFVRRLRHLQHICQSMEGRMKDCDMTIGKVILLPRFFNPFFSSSSQSMSVLSRCHPMPITEVASYPCSVWLSVESCKIISTHI